MMKVKMPLEAVFYKMSKKDIFIDYMKYHYANKDYFVSHIFNRFAMFLDLFGFAVYIYLKSYLSAFVLAFAFLLLFGFGIYSYISIKILDARIKFMDNLLKMLEVQMKEIEEQEKQLDDTIFEE